MNEVLCTGLVVADHVCAPVSHMPKAGELVMTDDMLLTIGGGASNTAIDLTKMGIRPAILACVGNDPFGRIMREILESHRVDTSHLKISSTRPTSQTLIVNVAREDRRFIHLIGANADFTAEDIPLDLVARSKVFYLGYLFIMPGLKEEELVPVFQMARAAGSRVVVDVAVPGRADYVSRLEKILPHVDVFVPNQDEAELILGERDPIRQADAFRKMGADTVVITMGAAGSILVSERLRLRADVYSVDFVDGTGSGDAFDAGYIYGLVKGYDAERCLQIASALGASCVRAIGTTPGVFKEEDCLEFVRKNPLSIERL